MKKRTIKIICMCIVLAVMLATIPVIVFANSSNRIYANDVTAKPGETVEIPVSISNNTGFMGASIVFSYDASLMTPVSAEKGELITKGLYDDSIGTSDKAEFKVIWCGSEEIVNDGQLCVVKFKVSDNASGECKVKVSYESKNTFDKEYKDVKLNCEDITVNVQNGASPAKVTIWQRIVNFFEGVWNWIKGLFVK